MNCESKLLYIHTETIGFCGCGNPEEMMGYIKTMLEKLDSKDWGNYEDKPYMFFVYWADKNGFTDHGTTVRCSWLTEKGKELLNNIKLYLQKEYKDYNHNLTESRQVEVLEVSLQKQCNCNGYSSMLGWSQKSKLTGNNYSMPIKVPICEKCGKPWKLVSS